MTLRSYPDTKPMAIHWAASTIKARGWRLERDQLNPDGWVVGGPNDLPQMGTVIADWRDLVEYAKECAKGIHSLPPGGPLMSLFVAFFPTGISYCDTSREEHGDYVQVAFLPYRTLALEVRRPRSRLLPKVRVHAAAIQAKRGQTIEVSQCGHTVKLGE